MASWQIKQLEKMSETDPDLIDDVPSFSPIKPCPP